MNLNFKKLTKSAITPAYATAGASGLDLHADVHLRTVVHPGCRFLIPTGIAVELPEGFEAQVRPRSGLALKKGITVLNAPGTVDSDYRAGIGVILFNASDVAFDVMPGDRIAQLVIAPVMRVRLEEVAELSDTVRGEGGYGSTGVAVAPV